MAATTSGASGTSRMPASLLGRGLKPLLQGGGGCRGREPPPAYWLPGSPEGPWCSWRGDARLSSANVRHPATAHVQRGSHSCLTACPGPNRRRPRSVAGKGRAFGACCFAGKLRSPAGPGSGAAVADAVAPTLVGTRVPTRAGGVPHPSLLARICPAQSPFGGVERPRRVVRVARLIQRPGRVLGVPSARVAFGGNLGLPWVATHRGAGCSNGSGQLRPKALLRALASAP
jgi:hypothetical protein